MVISDLQKKRPHTERGLKVENSIFTKFFGSLGIFTLIVLVSNDFAARK